MISWKILFGGFLNTLRTLGIALAILTLTTGLVGATEELPLNNNDIIKLTKLAMGDEVVISKIKTAKVVNFDTSTDDLVKLKESGVSGPVITAMLDRSVSGAVAGAKTTTQEESKVAPAIVTFYRGATFPGSVVDIMVVANGREIGTLSNGGYFNVKLPAGKQSVSLEAQGFKLYRTFDFDPGGIYFLQMEISRSFFAGASWSLKMVKEEIAMEAIKSLKESGKN